jgi:hypothetical protein
MEARINMTDTLTSLRLENDGVTAHFDPGTGRMISLATRAGRGIFEGDYFRFRVDGVFHTDKQDATAGPGVSVLTCVDVQTGPGRVRSVWEDALVRVVRDYWVPGNGQLMRVRTSIRALGAFAGAMPTALPMFPFAKGFADPLGDERDHYFDGCELDTGLELGAWRVFFHQEDDEGLFLATKCREQMTHVQVLAEGIEINPHRAVLYKTDMGARFPALTMAKGDVIRHEMWVGGWSKEKHAEVVGSLGLDVPRRRRAPALTAGVGERSKHEGGLVFNPGLERAVPVGSAFDAAAWRVAPAPWCAKGKALYAPSEVFPAPVEIAPGVEGRHRIIVETGPGSAPLVRVDGRAVYRTSPGGETCFDRVLAGEMAPTDMDFGVHELTKASVVSIGRTPARHGITFVGAVRVAPTSDPVRLPRAGALGLHSFIDTPDIGSLNDCRNPGIEPYHAVIREHACMGFSSLLWRIDGQVTEYPTNIGTRRYTYGKVHGVYSPMTKEGGRIQRKVDMLKEALDAAHGYGLKVVGWMRFNAYWGNVQSEFYRDHPQFWETWENGSSGRKLCLAHPEVRAHKRAILVEAARYGLDGLNLGFLRHAPILHRAPILVEGYRKEYGEEPPLHNKPGELDFNNKLPYGDEKSVRWFKYRARFMTEFGRELKADLKAAGLGHVPVSIWVRPNHCLYDGIDMEAWLAEGLCDGVFADSMHSGRVGEPSVDPTPQWEAMVRAKVPLVRGLSAFVPSTAREHLGAFLKRYDGVSIYEGNQAVIDPGFREMFEAQLDRLEERLPGS